MTPIIVLFNLKQGVSPEAYEAWARSTDLPIVRGLKSIAGFDVYKSKGLLRGGAAPYQYVEMIMVQDMDAFGADVASPTMQRVSGEFRTYADDPTFVLCERLT
ncbi:MAG TPA: REDY-like protein HapK [Alphaproteobacteria bacterium]|nr:REDY-like protein HapK [Alphaproteobacteria bacterium]